MPSSNSKTDAHADLTPPAALPSVTIDSILGRAVAGLVVIGLGLGLIVPKVGGGAFLLLSAIAIVWLEPALTRRRAQPVTVPGDRLLILAVIGFVTLWLAAWALTGFGAGGGDDFGRILRLLLIIPLYLFLRRVEGLDAAVWWGVSLGALLAAVHAMNLTLDPPLNPWDARAGGATNPIYFGGVVMAFALMLLPHAASPATRPVERLVATIAILAGLLAAALSGSRSAWLAVPMLLAVYAFALTRGQRPLRRFGWPLTLVVATGLLALIPGVPLGGRILEGIDTLNGPSEVFDPFDTLAVRWELWRVAAETIGAHPLLGDGPGAFRAAMQSAAVNGSIHPELLRYEHPHSQYLSALIINGVPGLLSLLALFGVPILLAARGLQATRREQRHMAWGTITVVGVLAAVALGESIFQRNAGIVWFAFLTALTLARARADVRR